ncbi:hypothetical protein UK99_11020 [Frankia casuarinae]|uniref:rhodanese-like domain-containing protein n=1 Tax=Frankia TaxID=1854 RepID=UPI0004DCB104|nr:MULTISPECIES: rhodanese-like domain-containing protein [Frankia]KEZ34836.1 Rhodanese-related sulfurtransferase [Frankia sp. CeD]ORT95946.1 hypothetical protein UK99_11020 [Frankia casuarinae]
MVVLDQRLLESCRRYVDDMPPRFNYMTSPELAKALESHPDAYFVLDNRTPEAYAAGHIPGAVNMWFKDVLSDSNLALLPRDKTIIIVCWVGHTASQLVALLGLLGFTVAGLQYGMGESPVPDSPRAGWRDLGLPLEKKIG